MRHFNYSIQFFRNGSPFIHRSTQARNKKHAEEIADWMAEWWKCHCLPSAITWKVSRAKWKK